MSQRDSEAGSALVPLAVARSAARFGLLMSAFLAVGASRNAPCGARLAWRRPPLGLGASPPVARKDFISLTTKETDTLKSAAAHDRPPSTKRATLSRRSRE